ncbi:MAG TPA: hypothetical protein VE078_07985 [Thermoanaerobaculia bacterium]|nr:hypothetical protein [Thermoanaerobaculia bacterium]
MGYIGLILLSIFIAFRSRKIGYSGLLWGIVSFLLGPLIALGLLGALPDRSLEKKRRREMKLLEAQLAQVVLPARAVASLPRETVSDFETIR